MAIKKRTIALSYVMTFLIGGVFFGSLHTNQPAKGSLWLTILLFILSTQLNSFVSAKARKILISLQVVLCAGAVTLLFASLHRATPPPRATDRPVFKNIGKQTARAVTNFVVAPPSA